MKTLIALACCSIFVSAQAADPMPSDSPPPYCVDFSPAACARIKVVVESKIRPDYCVPGFGLQGSGLTREQLRICYAMPEAQRRQMIEDARAMVSESWEKYIVLIKAIEVGYKCDVLDETSANAALLNIQVAMQSELNQAGLSGDPVLDIQASTGRAVQAGKVAAEHGACARMSPASRGRLRSLVSDLMR